MYATAYTRSSCDSVADFKDQAVQLLCCSEHLKRGENSWL